MRHLRAFPYLFVIFVSVFLFLAARAEAAGEVKLIKASSYVWNGVTDPNDTAAVNDTNSVQTTYFLILIKNIAYMKAVTLWFKNDTAWDTLPASWVRQADDDNEYWQLNHDFTVKYGFTDPMRDLEFKIKFAQGANVYWDDNGGKNYKLSRNGGTLLNGVHVLLKRAQWAVDTGASADSSVLSGDVEVRGWQPGGGMTIAYTADNLKTQGFWTDTLPPTPTWPEKSGTAPADSDKVWLYHFSFSGIKLPYDKNPNLHFHLKYYDGAHDYVDNNLLHEYTIEIGTKLDELAYEDLPAALRMRRTMSDRAGLMGRQTGWRLRISPLFQIGSRWVDGIGRSR